MKVDAIIGSTWSGATNALAPLARTEKLVVFDTSTLPEGLSFPEGEGYLFSNALALEPETAPFGEKLMNFASTPVFCKFTKV